MLPVGFKPAISAGVWTQTYALDRAATESGLTNDYPVKIMYGMYKMAVSTDRERKKTWRRMSQNYAGGSGYSS